MLVKSVFLLFFMPFSSTQDIKIFGGGFAEQNQFPHQVALIFRQQLRCGGSILTADWVLTAAHCVIRRMKMLVLTSRDRLFIFDCL
jgi:secreted trypsin-like serine protease